MLNGIRSLNVDKKRRADGCRPPKTTISRHHGITPCGREFRIWPFGAREREGGRSRDRPRPQSANFLTPHWRWWNPSPRCQPVKSQSNEPSTRWKAPGFAIGARCRHVTLKFSKLSTQLWKKKTKKPKPKRNYGIDSNSFSEQNHSSDKKKEKEKKNPSKWNEAPKPVLSRDRWRQQLRHTPPSCPPYTHRHTDTQTHKCNTPESNLHNGNPLFDWIGGNGCRRMRRHGMTIIEGALR